MEKLGWMVQHTWFWIGFGIGLVAGVVATIATLKAIAKGMETFGNHIQ